MKYEHKEYVDCDMFTQATSDFMKTHLKNQGAGPQFHLDPHQSWPLEDGEGHHGQDDE